MNQTALTERQVSHGENEVVRPRTQAASEGSFGESRPAALLQRKLSAASNSSPAVRDLATLQAKIAGNGGTQKTAQLKSSLNGGSNQPIQMMNEVEAATKLQALIRGRAVRRQVSVQSESPGIISTAIRPPSPGGTSVAPPGSPLHRIQSLIRPGATYNRLRSVRGARAGGVFGTGTGEAPVAPDTLALQAPPTTAVINGGYFVHKGGLRTDTGDPIVGLGRPVGPTSTRGDHTPIPEPWTQDYGQVNVGGEVGVSSGPLLALSGHSQAIPADDRFRYRVGGEENPLNNRAGALTHASDNNERAAISIDEASDDTILHTLTARGQRHLGSTMLEWQALTGLGANPYANRPVSTLNLDGGGSVFMGVRTPHGVRTVSRGGDPNAAIRPVANVIATRPS